MSDFGATFCKRTVIELKKRGVHTGLAVLQYCRFPSPFNAHSTQPYSTALFPAATFPTPLRQAVLALEHLISSGVRPENIQIAGDSAGGSLALQLVSHMLHPLDSVPRVTLSRPIGGMYLMSPGVSFSGHGGSLLSNEGNDVTSAKRLTAWGSRLLEGIPDTQRHYMEAFRAPDLWFQNGKTAVDRVLITAGELEVMRDEIVVFADRFCREHGDVQFVLQKHGVHIDPIFDFFTGETAIGEVTLLLWDWLATGFKRV